MAATANKFTKNLTLSHKDVRGKRATFIAKNAEDAQIDLVRSLEAQSRALESKLLNLEDLQPDSSVSLRATGSDFDAATWVAEMQSTKMALALKNVEVDLAKGTLTEYFG